MTIHEYGVGGRAASYKSLRRSSSLVNSADLGLKYLVPSIVIAWQQIVRALLETSMCRVVAEFRDQACEHLGGSFDRYQ